MTNYELGLEIANEGRYEEFYSKKPLYYYNRLQHGDNAEMQEFHKQRRLELQRQYNECK